MRKLTFMMATLALVATAFSSCKKEKEAEEQPLVVNIEQAEVPGEMGNFVKLATGEKTVTFEGKKASFDVDVTTLKQARYCEDASIVISLLDESKQPLGDFANFTTDAEALKKVLQDKAGNYTLTVTSGELTDEQVQTMKEKAKYAAATAAQGIDTWYFTGKLNGKYPVHIAIAPDMTEGTYYYDKSGINNPMYLSITEYNPQDDSLKIEETNADGMVCGYWDVKVDKEGMKGNLDITFSGKSYSVDLPRYTDTPKDGEFSDPVWKKGNQLNEVADEDSMTASASSMDTSDYDSWIDEYEAYFNTLAKCYKKFQNGDQSAYADYIDALQKFNSLTDKLQAAQSAMTPAQATRISRILQKFTQEIQL